MQVIRKTQNVTLKKNNIENIQLKQEVLWYSSFEKECDKLGIVISRRKMARIMRNTGINSAYTVAKYKVNKTNVNEEKVSNVVNREFVDRARLEVLVSDLTYVRVGGNGIIFAPLSTCIIVK